MALTTKRRYQKCACHVVRINLRCSCFSLEYAFPRSDREVVGNSALNEKTSMCDDWSDSSFVQPHADDRVKNYSVWRWQTRRHRSTSTHPQLQNKFFRYIDSVIANGVLWHLLSWYSIGEIIHQGLIIGTIPVLVALYPIHETRGRFADGTGLRKERKSNYTTKI